MADVLKCVVSGSDNIYLSNNINLHVMIDNFLNEEDYLLVNGLDFFVQKYNVLSEISMYMKKFS